MGDKDKGKCRVICKKDGTKIETCPKLDKDGKAVFEDKVVGKCQT
jgi:hypothetical protein